MTAVFLVVFEQIQYFYLLYLVVTNITTSTMIWVTLKQMLWYYFYEVDTLLYALYRTRVYTPISILAPAYNEQETIVSSVYSLLKLDFREYEIILINDGSNDKTLQQVITHFHLHPVAIPDELELDHADIRAVYRSDAHKNLIVIDKVNGGKADALNAAINLATYPLICCVDADTILEKDAILYGLGKFIRDRRVIAVGGAIGITNGSVIKNHQLAERKVPNSFIEGFQVLEYLRGFFAGRVGWQKYNGLILISGAFGIFKKDIVMKVKGYRHTIGEDLDLLIRMRRYCYDNGIDHKVNFVSQILCWTQCPGDYSSLLKQRNRWHRGLLETLYYHRKMLFNPKYGIVGMLTLPYFLFIEAFGPLITFMGVISIIVLYIFGLANPYAIIIFFLLEFVWGIMLNIFALYLDLFTKHAYKGYISYFKLLLLSFFEPFFYKPLLKAELFIATFNFMNANWGEIKRKAL
jgi:cellulose synthase/poly-beta-1,6-N-acetylglucosamine synthase-like glycosyltransferase